MCVCTLKTFLEPTWNFLTCNFMRTINKIVCHVTLSGGFRIGHIYQGLRNLGSLCITTNLMKKKLHLVLNPQRLRGAKLYPVFTYCWILFCEKHKFEIDGELFISLSVYFKYTSQSTVHFSIYNYFLIFLLTPNKADTWHWVEYIAGLNELKINPQTN